MNDSVAKLSMVPIDMIDFDEGNPRIRSFIEIYGDDIDPAQFHLALGSSGDNDGYDKSGFTTFEKLSNSIRMNGGVIQPVILNLREDGRHTCVEGNTRLAIYRDFEKQGIPGGWSRIPALVYKGLNENDADAVRLQIHLVGPRPWDPYSKAKYLNYLVNAKRMSFEAITSFCGGNANEISRSISAFKDMEEHYRDILSDDGEFDQSRFSAFVEIQKAGMKKAISDAGFDMKDFSHWVHEGLIHPLNTVRRLPQILRDDVARKVFLEEGARNAIAHIDVPDSDDSLDRFGLILLARAFKKKVSAIDWREAKEMKSNSRGETALTLLDVRDELTALLSDWDE